MLGAILSLDTPDLVCFGEKDSTSSDLCLKRLPLHDDRFRDRDVDYLWGVVKSGDWFFFNLFGLVSCFFAILDSSFDFSSFSASMKLCSG